MANVSAMPSNGAKHLTDWMEDQGRELRSRLVAPGGTKRDEAIIIAESISELDIAPSTRGHHGRRRSSKSNTNASVATPNSAATPALTFGDSDSNHTHESDTESRSGQEDYERPGDPAAYLDIESRDEVETHNEGSRHDNAETDNDMAPFHCFLSQLKCKKTFETQDKLEDHLLEHFTNARNECVLPSRFSIRCPRADCTVLQKSEACTWAELVDHISQFHEGGQDLGEERSDQFLYECLGRNKVISHELWKRFTSGWKRDQCMLRDPRQRQRNRQR